MSTRVTNVLKKQVAERAGHCCEYCKLRESTSFFTFHVDHIFSQKHGGLTILPNLAYGCPYCNYFKGSDVATFIDEERTTRFFNPRKDLWDEHFELLDCAIYGKTEIGIATAKIFKFNEVERLIFRRQLAIFGQYP